MTPETGDFQVERSELEAVLSSEAFVRSPTVAHMLHYICERHFAGLSHEVKEYNIAVEALGRPTSFDQAQDSIVRVEAHRLRKRLREYYHGPGSQHTVQITVPAGNYVPLFVRHHGVSEAGSIAEPVAVTSEIPQPVETPAISQELPVEAARTKAPPRPRVRLRSRVGIAASILALAIAAHFWGRNGLLKWPSVAAKASALPTFASAPDSEIRILAGSTTERFVDHYGNTWLGDRFFQGGEARSVPARVIDYSQDPALYLHSRQGTFSYHIPLKQGVYELRLHFAETVFGENNIAGGGETSRVFQIRTNGAVLIGTLDVTSDAGGSNTADIKVFRDIQPAADGMLHLEFLHGNNEVPFVNAIEILPSKPGAIRPVRILARDGAHTDQSSRPWSADRYFHNGVLVQRHEPVANTEEETLYQGERFGNFSYVIPVALNGRYTVTMKFCEAWFGDGRTGGRGVGGRVFDISYNGRILLANFDVFREAGSLHALDKTFKGLAPNTQGKLIFTFTPTHNYAMINAIEVVDEAWK
jgi:hypothetical protein